MDKIGKVGKFILIGKSTFFTVLPPAKIPRLVWTNANFNQNFCHKTTKQKNCEERKEMGRKKKKGTQPSEPDPEISSSSSTATIKKRTTSMAESSSSSNNYGSLSPITHMAQDHLFSILLLLPIDSILSFSMTCKRFKSITYSDALWESICRRDWGPTSVDAIKSSSSAAGTDSRHHHLQLPWMELYRQFYQLDSVSCHRLSEPDCDESFPGPRASHSFNFVSGCLVLFGGGCEGGQFFFKHFQFLFLYGIFTYESFSD